MSRSSRNRVSACGRVSSSGNRSLRFASNWGRVSSRLTSHRVRELKDEHQQPVEQQHGEPMPALVGVARVGNPPQAGEQGGQLAAQDAHLSAHRHLAGLLLCGDGGVGRADIGQRYGGAGEQSRLAPLLVQRLFLLFFSMEANSA